MKVSKEIQITHAELDEVCDKSDYNGEVIIPGGTN